MFCRMSDEQQDRTISVQDAWRDAETAYADEVAKYLPAASLDAVGVTAAPMTRPAFKDLRRLRDKADGALPAYLGL